MFPFKLSSCIHWYPVFEIKGAPCMHDLATRCTILKAVHPVCARFFLYICHVFKLDDTLSDPGAGSMIL